MRKLLATVLILNSLTDGPVGALIIFSPEAMLPDVSAESLFWKRNYGVTALSVACMAIWLWPSRDDYRAMGVGLGYLMGFHTVLAVVLDVSEVQLAGAIIHTVLAALFISLFFQRAKWCAALSTSTTSGC